MFIKVLLPRDICSTSFLEHVLGGGHQTQWPKSVPGQVPRQSLWRSHQFLVSFCLQLLLWTTTGTHSPEKSQPLVGNQHAMRGILYWRHCPPCIFWPDCPIYQSPRRAVCARPGDPSPQLLRPLLREYMKKNQFPPDLQRSVLDQEIHNFTRRQGMDVDAIFSELPRSLLRDVLLHMYGDLLAKVPMLDGTEDGFRLELMERLTTVTIFAEFCEIESCSGHGLGETGSQAFVRPGPCPPCRAIHHQVAVNLVEKGNERKGTVPRHVHCRRERRERVWQSFASAPQPASQGDRQVARRGFGGTAARSRDASAANHQVVCVCKDSSELHCACHNVGQSQGRGRAWSRPIRIYQHDPPTQPP